MKFVRYRSRFEAGVLLTEFIKQNNKHLNDYILENREKCFCFAIPNGGVPVAEGFCNKLNINYDIIIVRKIKVPYNTEAGFGSVTTDGTVLLNEPLLNNLYLSKSQVENSIEITKNEINDRLKFYDKSYSIALLTSANSYSKIVFRLYLF